jgi:diaminopimelate decarboxylase
LSLPPAPADDDVRALVAEHGSPLWLVDVDRARDRLRAFRAAWDAEWPDVEIVYSYKTNRTRALLHAVAAEGAAPEVVCAAEYALARDVVRAPGWSIVVNGPVKPDALLERAAADGALVVVDSAAELERAAAAGVSRVGIRVTLPGVGAGTSRFGIPPAAVPAAARAARALDLTLEVLHAHVVSTGFRRPLREATHLAESIAVEWPPPPDRHAHAAAVLADLAAELDVDTIDLGGGHPPAPAVADHARAVAATLRERGFAGRLVLEPGRAVVADAVDLALSVAAVKRLDDGTRCVVVDAGTNLLPGALWSWPRLEALGAAPTDPEPALVTGPLCLNVDVLDPAAALPHLEPGDLLLARAVGAYQQVQSTGFGDLHPAVAAYDEGRWHLAARSETIGDVIAGDQAASPFAGISTQEEDE